MELTFTNKFMALMANFAIQVKKNSFYYYSILFYHFYPYLLFHIILYSILFSCSLRLRWS
jgi:hypothetical protein